MARGLEVIESCDGCGDCCRVVVSPPFVRQLDGGGEEAWLRLRWDAPELQADWIAQEKRRRELGHPSTGSPCHWFDEQTRRCTHHEFRPQACRVFEIGGLDCRDARR